MARAKEFESAINGRDIKFAHMIYKEGRVDIVTGSVKNGEKWQHAAWNKSGECVVSGLRFKQFDLNLS